MKKQNKKMNEIEKEWVDILRKRKKLAVNIKPNTTIILFDTAEQILKSAMGEVREAEKKTCIETIYLKIKKRIKIHLLKYLIDSNIGYDLIHYLIYKVPSVETELDIYGDYEDLAEGLYFDVIKKNL